MAKAPISMCIIVKNDPHLENAVKSIRDYVEEIVIVDTGSTPEFQVKAKELANIFEIYTGCNDSQTGLINDFSNARQRSFDISNQPWVMWMDSDDTIVGAEHLIELTKENNMDGKDIAFMFPYEYSYDELGQCTCLHYRERLFSNKTNFHWVNPVHEVIIPKDNSKVRFITADNVVYKHRRQYSEKQIESGRNLRILKKYLEKVGDSDARQLYYIGLEYYNNGFVNEAIENLIKYVSLSGWDDERVMACLKLVDIYQQLGDYESGLNWALKSISIHEKWGEGYFAAGKMFYFLATKGGSQENRNWEKCVYFLNLSLQLPETKTLLFINPLDRSFTIHLYLNMALSKLAWSSPTDDGAVSYVQKALDSVNTGLKIRPNDVSLLNNKLIYENWLNDKEVILHLNRLKELSQSNKQAETIIKSLSNGLGIISDDELRTWQIPDNYSLDGLPLNISDNQLESCVIMFWKQYMLHNQTADAISFLESAPGEARDSYNVKKALDITKRFLKSESELNAAQNQEKSSDKVLDIIFFAGDGVENWTPDTVKRTGIGGSELMLLEMAKRFAADGHKVRVYNSCGFFGEGIYDGVQYYQTNKFKNLNCDVLVVSRRTEYLSDHFNIKSKLRLLWVHDVVPINYSNELLLKADRILCLSDWHKQFVIDNCNVHPNHIIKTRNGIDLKRFTDKNIEKDKYKCVNFSSPDRSWPILLSIWPRIKEKVPSASLTLGYGFKNWEFSAKNDPLQMDLINSLKKQIKELEPFGVRYLDRINQEQIAEEYLSASVLLYPTWFTETSYIGGMECTAAGTRFIGSSIAAINETIGDRGALIPGKWTDLEYQDRFVDETVKTLLLDEGKYTREQLQQYAKDNFCLDKLSQEWEKIFFDLIEEKEKNPIVPYYPTVPYRENGNGYSDGDTRLPEDHPERRKQ